MSLVSGDGSTVAPALVVERHPGPGGSHPHLVNGTPVAAELRVRDRERAILVDGDAAAGNRRLLLLPPAAAPGAARGVARREIIVDGWRIEVDVEPAARAELRDRARRGRDETVSGGPVEVRAIIPGVVVSVFVAPGDVVAAGEHLLVLEAMKMQNELRAPRDGTIEQVAVAAGDKLEAGDLMLVIA
ncbi:MAG TPA: biotin/lipoyl-containing protein [Candidatus Sulfomarinibacteraceae bacterium]|nr:biotin/lipoyl-containing protein [Candidatus Sulfomarinibacteraceae bacterium]